jgi:cysteinyl-tRNA synthetase
MQEDELDLAQRIQSAQRQVHACLCDNVDTAGAMDAISGLIKSVNLYLGKKEAAGAAAASRAPAQALLLRKAAAFVTKILSVMGIVDVPSDRWELPAGCADKNSRLVSSAGFKKI